MRGVFSDWASVTADGEKPQAVTKGLTKNAVVVIVVMFDVSGIYSTMLAVFL